jgi:hypothetical protein
MAEGVDGLLRAAKFATALNRSLGEDSMGAEACVQNNRQKKHDPKNITAASRTS